MSMSLMDFRLEILKQEIEIINEKVNHFDNLRHQTKQMAITLWLAALGVGITAKVPLVLILAALVPFPFWALESGYHAYQEGWYARLQSIRTFIRDGRFNVQGKDDVTLDDFLKGNDSGKFPVPDYYGNRTLPVDIHRQKTSVLRNFIKVKMVLFYLPLSVVSLVFVLFI